MSSRAFTGRTRELETIGEVWRQARTGTRPQTVVLTGPPGAGKSRLIAEAVAGLTPAPGVVLIGHAGRPGPAPYDWLATALRRRDVSGLPVAADTLAWLTQSRDAPPRRMEPTSLLRAATEVVRHLVGGDPGVVVVEDFPALDPASVALVERLTTTEGLPVMLFIATRPAASGPSPAAQTALLDRLTDAVRLTVPPVDAATVAGTEAVWARYAHAIGRHEEAAVAALHGAAGLLAAGEAAAARRLIEECLAGPPPSETDGAATQLVLAQTLLRLGRPEDAESAVRAAAGEPEAARLSETLRTIGDLTGREREVLSCLAAGMTNRQVARALDISVRTVTVHVSNLLRKTGTASRTEAALWAVQHGLAGEHRGPGPD